MRASGGTMHACTQLSAFGACTAGAYFRWNPPLCRLPFKTDTLRFELDTSKRTGVYDWIYMDYVQVHACMHII